MKNKTLRIGLIVLLLVCVTLSIISGTLAKYVEVVKGTDSARVAKFDYEAKVGTTELTTQGVSLNLFNTAFDDQVYGATNNINTEKLVAPGTYGSFDIVATNKSEVDVSVKYSITETNNGEIPIIYFVKNGNTVNYYSSVETGEITLGSDVKTGIGASTDTITVSGNLSAMADLISATLEATTGTAGTPVTTTIGWFWAFGDPATKDTRDTEKGKATTLGTVNVEVKATFEQVD